MKKAKSCKLRKFESSRDMPAQGTQHPFSFVLDNNLTNKTLAGTWFHTPLFNSFRLSLGLVQMDVELADNNDRSNNNDLVEVLV